jgi:16S rRNA (guanine527-N7)-methyltransferase
VDRGRFVETLAGIGLTLSDAQIEAFESFDERLYAANAVMNLTRVPREEAWLRHFVDSLLFHDLIPEGSEVLDVGTGPGFPAWPLAAARPDLRVTALDSSGKMIGFLAQNPLPNLRAVVDRAETWGVREGFDVVTGRAVAPFGIQLELSAPPSKVGGLIIPMRTPSEKEAVKGFPAPELGLQPAGLHERALPGTDIVRLFPVYRKVAATPSKYPRPWAEIKRAPLG